MKADRLLKFFVPKENAFVDLFEENSRNLVNAARLLKEMMLDSSYEQFEIFQKEIKNIEHTADSVTNKIYEQLNKSLITAFDRDDIHQITGHLDEVVDLINGVSRRIVLYRPKKLAPVFVDLTGLILEAAQDINSAIILLRSPEANKLKIIETCSRIKDWERKADELYFSGVSDLYSGESDTKELIKISKILETLEKCINEEEKVSNTIKTIIIKIL